MSLAQKISPQIAPKELPDIFQDDRRMPCGPLKGQPLKTYRRRSVFFLKDRSYRKNLGVSARDFIVANILHNREFYILRIDPQQIQETRFLFEFDGVHSPHPMLRFRAKKNSPFELIAKIPTREMRAQGIHPRPFDKPIYLQDIVFSAEVVRAEGHLGFSVKRALNREYALASRLLSTESIYYQAVTKGRGYIEQYKTNFTTEESWRIFSELVSKATHQDLKQMYDVFHHNCRTALFRPFLRAIPRLDSSRPKWVHECTPFLSTVFKKSFVLYLARRGYLRIWPDLPNLGYENGNSPGLKP